MSRDLAAGSGSYTSTPRSSPSMTISVASLLNPLPSATVPSSDTSLDTPALTSGSYTPSLTSSPQTPTIPSLQPFRSQLAASQGGGNKLPKDAPLFTSTPSPTRGPIRYKPHEHLESPGLMRELERFSIYPLGNIATHGVRHIPYASDKKNFHDKTGREGFEVFQYTYSLPPEMRISGNTSQKSEYTVMWDYNIGLVRITPFFKSCGYSKTTPAKMLTQNPTLRPLSHSITGGSLAAQGYWLPFEAAKHICASFTHPIRYALVPLFGPAFLDLCKSRDDPGWARMICPPGVIEQAAQELARIRDEDSRANTISSPPSLPAHFNHARHKSMEAKPRLLSPASPSTTSFPSPSKRKRAQTLSRAGSSTLNRTPLPPSPPSPPPLPRITTLQLPKTTGRSSLLVRRLSRQTITTPKQPDHIAREALSEASSLTASSEDESLSTSDSASDSDSISLSGGSSSYNDDLRPSVHYHRRRRQRSHNTPSSTLGMAPSRRHRRRLTNKNKHKRRRLTGHSHTGTQPPTAKNDTTIAEGEDDVNLLLAPPPPPPPYSPTAALNREKERERERDTRTAYLLVQLARADEELARLKERTAAGRGKEKGWRAV